MDKATTLAVAIEKLVKTLGENPQVIYLIYALIALAFFIFIRNLVTYLLDRKDSKELNNLLIEIRQLMTRNIDALHAIENYLRGGVI